MSNELITRLYDEAQDNPDSLEWKAADLIEQQQKRIEELKDKLFDAKGKASEKRIELICNLAAAQAQIKVMRKAYALLENFASSVGGSSDFWEHFNDELEPASIIAHFDPPDDSALRELLKAERERVAKLFDGAVWGYDYREIAAAIRAMEDK